VTKRWQILFLILLPLVVYGQDVPATDVKAAPGPAAKASPPGEDSEGEVPQSDGESAPLKPIPESMDAKMMEQLASEPHDGEGMMLEMKIFNRPGLYKNVSRGGPSEEEINEEVNFSRLKLVRRRFLVSESPQSNDKEAYRQIHIWTYDRKRRAYRMWSRWPGGRQEEYRGTAQPDSRRIDWELVEVVGDTTAELEITFYYEMADDGAEWKGQVVVDGEVEKVFGGESYHIGEVDDDFPEREPEIVGIIFGTLCCLGIPTMLIAIFIVILVVKSQREKKRTSDFAAATEQLSLQFDPLGDVDLQQRLAGLPLCNIGRGQELKNLVTGGTAEVSVSIFDFRYITGYGKHRRVRRQTVLAMESSSLQLPTFNFRPERKMLDAIGGMIGLQDIDFEQHPGFSKAFVLKSNDEMVTREFFDETLLDLFASKPDMTFETLPTGFIVFRRWKKRRPEELQDLLEEGYTLFQALRDRVARG